VAAGRVGPSGSFGTTASSLSRLLRLASLLRASLRLPFFQPLPS
jgi:hypothetical protein